MAAHVFSPLQKSWKANGFSCAVKTLVTPSATFRAALKCADFALPDRLIPPDRACINSLVSEIEQSEKNATSLELGMMVIKTLNGREGEKLRQAQCQQTQFVSGLAGDHSGFWRLRRFRVARLRKTFAAMQKFLGEVTGLDKFLTISREDGQWMKQGFSWANM